MRRFCLAATAALCVMTSVAQAGGVKETMVVPAEVVKTTSSSAGGIVVPILLLIVLAAILSGNSGKVMDAG